MRSFISGEDPRVAGGATSIIRSPRARIRGGRSWVATGLARRLVHPFPKCAMHDLPRSGARHLLFANKRHRAWPFVARDAGSAPFQQLVCWNRVLVMHDDYCMHRFTPFFVRDANDGYVLNRRMLAEQSFNLRRVDVLAATDDHVALAIDEVIETFL